MVESDPEVSTKALKEMYISSETNNYLTVFTCYKMAVVFNNSESSESVKKHEIFATPGSDVYPLITTVDHSNTTLSAEKVEPLEESTSNH